MKTPLLAIIGFGACCLMLVADEPKTAEPQPIVEVSHTEHVDLPANGTLKFTNSTGVLTIEAWDQPGVEITTIKSTKLKYDSVVDRDKATRDLEQVRVTTRSVNTKQGDELDIATQFPHYLKSAGADLAFGENRFDLEYRIKAPPTTRIIADHQIGEVNLDGLISDMEVNLKQGEILLHLPEDASYDINAKSAAGAVNSDFPVDHPGREKQTWWLFGHRLMNTNSPGGHKLNLKVGWGDVVILRIRVPKTPGPDLQAAKPGAL
jgi:hypothetical protein